MKIEEMEKRAERLRKHIEEHPSDYTAVIAELMLKSDIIDRMRKDETNARLQRLARIRKKNEEQRQ